MDIANQAHHTIHKKRVQQREIAEAAGVSISTVSRVLNDVEGISQDLRERVLKAANALGYQSKEPALEQIHLYVATGNLVDDPFHMSLISGVEIECRRNNIALHYSMIEPGTKGHLYVLDKMMQNSNAGLIFMAVSDRELLEKVLHLTPRVVLVNAELPGLPVDTFLPDNQVGPMLAIRHLIAQGHRRILHTTCSERSTIRRRLIAYRFALEEAGIPYDPRLVLDTALNQEEVYEAMRAYLAADHPDFTAVFCANDFAAFGVARALNEANLRIPQDVSVVGYDDMPMAAFMSPPLTTIRIEREELGGMAARRLIERVAHPDLTPVRFELFSRLIERQSVTARED